MEKHLNTLRGQGFISVWHDRRISAGTEWKEQIDANLESANLILLLISADFVASDYCYGTEITRALERHAAGQAQVIPVILRPVDWHSVPFGKLQPLPMDGRPITTWRNREAAFVDVARGIRTAIETIRERRSRSATVRVFISYVDDSDAHVAAVRDLWVLLRRLGIDARLDRTEAERQQDWPQWMMEQLHEAAYVLVIASSAYKRRAEGPAGPDGGRGVQFEAALIREEFYRDRALGLRKFLPVVLPGASVDDIPVFLGPTTTTYYRVDQLSPRGVERLLRVLTDQPAARPADARSTQRTPMAFMSFVRADDTRGGLTTFRERLSDEISAHIGSDFPILQDSADPSWGQRWRERIEESLDAVTLLIPILTPRFFASAQCRDELRQFIEREQALHRTNLVLPVYYIDYPALNDPERQETDELLQVAANHQFADWRDVRFEPATSPAVMRRLQQLAVQVRDVLARGQAGQRPGASGAAPTRTNWTVPPHTIPAGTLLYRFSRINSPSPS